MVLTEYDEEAVMEDLREEAWEQGLMKGREESLRFFITQLNQTGSSREDIFAILQKSDLYKNITLEDIQKYL